MADLRNIPVRRVGAYRRHQPGKLHLGLARALEMLGNFFSGKPAEQRAVDQIREIRREER